MTADFQQYYGIDLEEVGRTVSVRRAAALAAMLPAGSRTLARIDPRNGLTEEAALLLALVNTVRGVAGANPVDPFAVRERSMTAAEFSEFLSRPRKEVADGD